LISTGAIPNDRSTFPVVPYTSNREIRMLATDVRSRSGQRPRGNYSQSNATMMAALDQARFVAVNFGR
jgi:hypothetical protein